jgi:hypothetical protein
MLRYFQSLPGRLLAFAIALPLVGALLPWHGEHAGLGALSLLAGLALAFVACGLSLEKHAAFAMTAMFAIPGAVFAYLGVVILLVPLAHGLVYLMALAALVLIVVALRPSLLAAGGTRPRTLRLHRI